MIINRAKINYLLGRKYIIIFSHKRKDKFRVIVHLFSLICSLCYSIRKEDSLKPSQDFIFSLKIITKSDKPFQRY